MHYDLTVSYSVHFFLLILASFSMYLDFYMFPLTDSVTNTCLLLSDLHISTELYFFWLHVKSADGSITQARKENESEMLYIQFNYISIAPNPNKQSPGVHVQKLDIWNSSLSQTSVIVQNVNLIWCWVRRRQNGLNFWIVASLWMRITSLSFR